MSRTLAGVSGKSGTMIICGRFGCHRFAATDVERVRVDHYRLHSFNCNTDPTLHVRQ